MKFQLHTHFAHILLEKLHMPKQPAYFDSQAAAAAALNVEIDDIREAKREGCPAFRSGRVYGKELLNWLEKRALQNTDSAKLSGIGLEKSRSLVAQTIRGLSVCANLGLLTPEQYFDFSLTIVEAADDPELREVFRQTILNWLQLNFSEIAGAKARKAHPKIMSWFRSETEAWARRKDEEGDLEALVRTLTAQ